jgi:hypothetical protein
MMISSLPVSVHCLVSPTANTTQRGQFFEDFTAALLRRQGWSVKTRLRVTGQEIDVKAAHVITGKTALVQCKFQSDPVSANTLYQLVGQSGADGYDEAWLYSLSGPTKDAAGLVADGKLRKYGFGFFGPEAIAELLHSNISQVAAPAGALHRHLLVWDKIHIVTAFEVRRRAGSIYEVYLEDPEQQESLGALLTECRPFSDAEFIFAPGARPRGQPKDLESDATHVQETVGPTPAADSAEDLRPARPSDFFGRESLIEDFETEVLRIADGAGTKRVFSIIGPSGIGKSSLVLRLGALGRRTWCPQRRSCAQLRRGLEVASGMRRQRRCGGSTERTGQRRRRLAQSRASWAKEFSCGAPATGPRSRARDVPRRNDRGTATLSVRRAECHSPELRAPEPAEGARIRAVQ